MDEGLELKRDLIDSPIQRLQQVASTESLGQKVLQIIGGFFLAPLGAMFLRQQGERAANGNIISLFIFGGIFGLFEMRNPEQHGILDMAVAGAIFSFLWATLALERALVWERERKSLFVLSHSVGQPPRWIWPTTGPRPSMEKALVSLSLLLFAISCGLFLAFPITGKLLAQIGFMGLVGTLFIYLAQRGIILDRRDSALNNEWIEQLATANTAAASSSHTLAGVEEEAGDSREEEIATLLFRTAPRTIRVTEAATRPEQPASRPRETEAESFTPTATNTPQIK